MVKQVMLFAIWLTFKPSEYGIKTQSVSFEDNSKCMQAKKN